MQYEQKQKKPVVVLTKEFDTFYSLFVEVYKKLDKELQNGTADPDTINTTNDQMNKILSQIETLPALEAIFPNVIHFIGLKNVRLLF